MTTPTQTDFRPEKSEVDFFQEPTSAYALYGTDLVCAQYPREEAPAVVKIDVRGGVRWPQVISYGSARTLTGAAVLLVSEFGSPVRTVCKEVEFSCVDDIQDDSKILLAGVGRFFNWAWSKFYCRTFYVHEHPETHRRFLRQIALSLMIRPCPNFWRIDWTDESIPEVALMEAYMKGTLLYKRDGLVHNALKDLQLSDRPYKTADIPPILAALAAALVGSEKHPRKDAPMTPAPEYEREEAQYAL